MTFEEIEQSARVGDLVFFSGRRAFSWLIRLRSGSIWSHVGMIVWEQNDQIGMAPQVVESLEGRGVQCVPLSCWRSERGRVALGRVDTLPAVRSFAADHAASKRGLRYASPWQFIRSFSVIWSRLRRLLRVPDDCDPQRYFCSELVAESLLFAGLHLPKPAACMYPGDVAQLPYVTLGPSVEVTR